ncbi:MULTISPECIES: non-ribosomal peptide synthetase [unclassified Pseudomonas]|uniref:non-ribosomal peptide synthetase n=1 Tax=unclassified Pseudomonas TaxID=196821 RepID=UPI00244690CA|nr:MULTISPECIES: non-ribosomal peptide synthetase [unclassified Pseudomonas]MDH0301928.1 amino acid adenylation domain-containing protein [Pseudomonas sp. GD04091]MDH1983784.1 amino acid adenylation domain-containing protein [Pseudomonas sp. GD03689]
MAVTDTFPLTSAQRDIWLDQLSHGDSPLYNIGGYIELAGSLDVGLLRQALDHLVALHDSLRTLLTPGDGGLPLQCFDAGLTLTLPVIDLGGEADPEAAATTLMRERMGQRFPLTSGPLARFFLVRLGPGRHWLAGQAHHLIIDGWGFDQLFDTLGNYYGLLASGSPLPEAAPSYRAFISDDSAYQASPRQARDRAYWLARYQSVPAALMLAKERVDSDAATPSQALDLPFDPDLLARMGKLAGELQASAFHVLLAALHVCCVRTWQRDEWVVGVPVRNRGNAQFKATLGLFTQVSALRMDFAGELSFAELVRAIRDALKQDFRHQRFALSELNRALGLLGEGRGQLFELSVSYEEQGSALRYGDVPGRSVKVCNGHEPTPLALHLRNNRQTGEAWLHLVFNLGWFDAGEVRALAGRLLHLLGQGLASPGLRVTEFDLPTAAEHERLRSFGHGRRTQADERCIHWRIAQQAASAPQAVAAWHEGHSLSYGELNGRANRLAEHLLALGVTPEDRVAICAWRGLDTLVGLLAILKAGAAYVPLDPAHPEERLVYLLQDCAPKVLLTLSALSPRLPADGPPRLMLDQGVQTLAADPQVLGLGAGNLAYVIYTSGSTGQPKGVMVEHGMLGNLVDWHCRAFVLRAGDQVSCLAGFGFDAMAWEVWPALCCGATLHLAPVRQGPEDIDALLRWWHAQPLDVSFLPTPVAEHVFAHGPDHPTLRTLLIGGDRLRHLTRDPRHALVNNYGPTEATVVASFGAVYAGQPLHIGGPLDNARLYVLDASQRLLPPGVAGELYIGGRGVARGYLGRPEMTAERFLDDPFSDEPGARMYRSGDLVRWQVDGTLEYLGRNDEQVKIRGVRVELAEIEAALARHAAVQECMVLLQGGQLVAWFIGAAEVAPRELHEHLAERLPAALLPGAYVRLPRWPLTANGKLDRQALPAPTAQASVRRVYAAPEGPTEQRLAALWAELLGVERVGRHDHFFELGGHSLLAVQLVERMRQEGLHADVQVLFGQPTLASLAASASANGSRALPDNLVPVGCRHITPDMLALTALEQPAIERIVAGVPGGAANVQEIYPLAPLQQGLLYHHITDARDPYQQQALFAFASREAWQAFARALQQVIERHDILRTSLAWEAQAQPQQVVWRQAELPVEVLPGGDDAEDRLKARSQPLDLRRAPMMALSVAEAPGQGRWLGLLCFHHLVNDALSLELLLTELRALLAGQGRDLPVPVPYRNFAAAHAAPGRERQHEAFFRQMLGDLEAPTRVLGVAGLPIAAETLQTLEHPVPLRLVQGLRQLARSADVSLASLFHLAWAQVLGSLSGQDEVVFGTVLLGRLAAGEGAERALGMFINTLPLRVSLAGRTLGQALGESHERLAALLAHEDAPQVLAQRCSALPAGMPLFDSLLNFRHGAQHRTALPGVELLGASEVVSQPLMLAVDDLGQAVRLSLRAPRSLGVERLLDYLLTTLEGLLAPGLDTPLTQLCSVPAGELQPLLVELNATEDLSSPVGQTWPALFAQQVQRTPDAIAVQAGDDSLSYRQLDAQANRLAHQLIELGVRPDTRVAICIERGLALMVGLLGILKAGGAYVPLDPGYPDERLRYMLADSAPLTVLVHDATEGLLASSAVPCVNLDRHDGRRYPDQAPQVPGLNAAHLAYVLYTSGSTGTPKGVMIEHRGLCNLMHWGSGLCPPRPGDALLQRAPFSFDGSVWELFWPLAAGLRLVLTRPDGHRDPAYLAELIRQRAVTTVKFVPALLHQFLEVEGVERCTSLTDIFCGGGELTLALASAVRARLPRVRLHNVYGPTEATVDSTAWTLEPDQPLPVSAPPIGRALCNTRLYLLDAHDRPVPFGAVGQLHIGGVGVARGYLGLPALQAERFIASPFVVGDRLYRTGDLARYREDGELEFLGRNDFQLKLRGLRVEPGEIEAQLASYPGLDQTVVLMRDERLVAYFTCRDGQPAPGLEALRSHMLARLPEYLVPSAFVALARWPLSPSGKVDRQALPEPGPESVISRRYVAPEGELETALAQIWGEVLRIEQVGRDDNFFELGGHSLLAVSLVARMRQAGLHADARSLFSQPTLAGLAASTRLQQARVEVPRTTIPGLQARRRL